MGGVKWVEARSKAVEKRGVRRSGGELGARSQCQFEVDLVLNWKKEIIGGSLGEINEGLP